MINFVNKNPFWQWILSEEIGHLERLVADLKRLLDDAYPTDDELTDAVVLVNPVAEKFPTYALKGFVIDHPELGSKLVVTSPIVVQATDWVRTVNRLYLMSPDQPVGGPS